MKTLKSIVVGLALGYNALACGPDSVNNYYGQGKGNSGSHVGGNYTCRDVALRTQWCMSQPGWDDYKNYDGDFVNSVEKSCLKQGTSQDCIDCLAMGDCDPVQRKSTYDFCVESGDCQK